MTIFWSRSNVFILLAERREGSHTWWSLCLILPSTSLQPPSEIGVKAKFSCFQSVWGRCLTLCWSNKTYSSLVFWLSVDHPNITNVYSLYKLSLENREDRAKEDILNNELSKMLTRTTLFPSLVSQRPTAGQSENQSSAPLQHQLVDCCHRTGPGHIPPMWWSSSRHYTSSTSFRYSLYD